MKKPLQILLISLILHLSLLITNCYSQWVQQTLPVSGLVYDMQFVNQNTGWAVLTSPNNVIRTTDGGNNWSVLLSGSMQVGRIKFFNDTTGYTIGRIGTTSVFSKTSNGGLNWTVTYSSGKSFLDMFFVNPDTGWIGQFGSGTSDVLLTTDSGQNFQQIYSIPGGGAQTIFFAGQKYSGNYHGWYSSSGLLFNTTNSGVNWTQYTNLPNNNAGYIYFLNKDTGWVSNFNGSQGYTMFTTNNGVNWTIQNLPSIYGAGDVYFHNNNTGWGAGGFGKVVATTNGGSNWGTQNAPFFTVNTICFINDMTGWCGGNGIAKTTNGGGNIIYDGIEQISNEIPLAFSLMQNYPNPFNPITNIKYQITASPGPSEGRERDKLVILKVFDIMGREITTLVNQKQNAGTYRVDWNANNYPSGVYFYRLMVEGYMETRKMLMIK